MEDQANYGNVKFLHEEYQFENGLKVIIEQNSDMKNVEALEKLLCFVNQSNPATLEEFIINLHSALQL
jgi:hypothetical protein